MLKQLKLFLTIFCIQGALFAKDEKENKTLKTVQAEIKEKIQQDRQNEVGLILYTDIAIIIFNDHPGSGSRQVHFRDKKDIETLKAAFERSKLPNVTVNETFQKDSSTLRCKSRKQEKEAELESRNEYPCSGGEKAKEQFEVMLLERKLGAILAKKMKENCKITANRLAIEQYGTTEKTYTIITYSCGNEPAKTITCNGNKMFDLDSCLNNQFNLSNWEERDNYSNDRVDPKITRGKNNIPNR